MDTTKLIRNDLKLPPLRSLDDFLLKSARFQIPNLEDLEKWGHRVVNNLLYYQTNYLFMSVIIFLIIAFLYPIEMLVGMLSMMAYVAIFAHISMEGTNIYYFKRQYPVVGVLFIVFTGCFTTYTLGFLLIFFLGILLPFCVTFVHASLRLRNMKNKIVNKIEDIGLKRTPMGVFLGHLEDVTGMTLRAQSSLIQPPH